MPYRQVWGPLNHFRAQKNDCIAKATSGCLVTSARGVGCSRGGSEGRRCWRCGSTSSKPVNQSTQVVPLPRYDAVRLDPSHGRRHV
jgi:hypothetical protein